VLVEEPSTDEAKQILRGIKERYEEFHGVEITEKAIEESVDLANRYIMERFLPDKGVDVLDEAASKVMLSFSKLPQELKDLVKSIEKVQDDIVLAKEKKDSELLDLLHGQLKSLKAEMKQYSKEDISASRKVVDAEAVESIISQWTGIPVSKINREESKRLLRMEKEMKGRVVGQDDAIHALVRAVKRSKVGLKDPRRPAGSFLFMGPTGVGKSELAKTMAEFLFGSRDAMIRIDMSEFMEKHTVSRLIGSPPGYVGFNEGGQLTEPVRRRPYSVVLFDELEKASPDVINVLLQLLDDGHITDASGRKVNFKNTFIIMTSNVGSKFIQQETSFGFVDPSRIEETKYDAIKQKLDQALRQEFKPEFLNRIDDIIVFKSLNEENIREIVDIMLGDVVARLEEKQISISYDKKVKDFLVKRGYDQRMGARPLRRSIQEHFEDKLADTLLNEGLKTSIDVKATVKKDEVIFTLKNQKKASSKGKASKELVST